MSKTDEEKPLSEGDDRCTINKGGSWGIRITTYGYGVIKQRRREMKHRLRRGVGSADRRVKGVIMKSLIGGKRAQERECGVVVGGKGGK